MFLSCPSGCPFNGVHRSDLPLSVNTLTRSLHVLWRDLNETRRRYLSRAWALLKRFSRPEVKGQDHNEAKRTFPGEGSISLRAAGHYASDEGMLIDSVVSRLTCDFFYGRRCVKSN